MEWVETTGRTIDEAKELALDQLGVHEEDAEFDVLEEPLPRALRAHPRRGPRPGPGTADAASCEDRAA